MCYVMPEENSKLLTTNDSGNAINHLLDVINDENMNLIQKFILMMIFLEDLILNQIYLKIKKCIL